MKRLGVILLVVLAFASVFGSAQVLDALDFGWFLIKSTDPFTGNTVLGVIGFADDYTYVSTTQTEKPGLGFGIDYGNQYVFLSIVAHVVVPTGLTTMQIRFDDEETVTIPVVGDSENPFRLLYVFVPNLPEYNEWFLKKLFTANTFRVRVQGLLASQSMSFNLKPLQKGFKRYNLIKEVEKFTGIKISKYLEDSYF